MSRCILIFPEEDIFDDDIELINDVGIASNSDALSDSSLPSPDFQAVILICLGLIIGCLLVSTWRFR